ncbi:phage portal protein [Aneurinibacillus sp. Ricciae_BoGa-3]|uniref:phage portal protein n=1 Tax=Aneurinibacillus sp. Ricciae_BoGa-3 TaxID=3022697 RepID=UPI002340ECD2|nr:phage portal protein [Aneurinibacillus sp. Ricciae_BoGa-3]WCK55133.1 phage portal protein [Aneurinibacillus sp. Ricciae_BoGa-3]
MIETLNLCSTKFYSELPFNKQKYNYYQDRHDIQENYKTQDRRSNQIAQCNFVGIFIDQETSYILGKPVTLIPKNGDESIIMDIDYNLAHWSRKHNQALCTDLGIYGKVFELYYINEDGEFCARIVDPKTGYAVIDENNVVTLFLHFYRKPFDFNEYVDVYTPNEIITYINNTYQEVSRNVNIFGRVPVAFCHINRTIFDMIKSLNDSFNITLSNGVNENSDLRSSFLKITGAVVKEEDIQFFDSKGIINVPKDANIDFLIKELNDAFLKTILQELNDKIYECTGHINFSQQPTSNTSSLALRGRLITLEQRCQLMSDSIADIISTRLKFLFQYLKIRDNKSYDYKNVDIRFTPNVPTDLLMLSNMISQLGGVELSQETKLSLLPFVENPRLEMQKIKSERQNNLNADAFVNPYDQANGNDNNDTVPDNGVPSDVPNFNIGVIGDE